MNIEPGIHTGDKGPQKKYTFSFWYFFIILMAFLLVNSFMVSRQPNIVQIDYNQFKQLVENRTIKRVNIETGAMSATPSAWANSPPTASFPWRSAAFATYKWKTLVRPPA